MRDYKESSAPKNWCFWTMLLEKTLESPLDFKKIQPIHPKGDQSWVFVGRTDVEAETPVLLPGKSCGRRSLVGCSPWGRKESDTTEWLHFHFSVLCIGEENGSPLQCSCLENLRDGGAWWAATYGVAQSRTQLNRLSSSSHIRLVITFLPRSKRLLMSWLQLPSTVILEPKKIKSHCFHCFPIYLPWNDGTRCHDLSL